MKITITRKERDFLLVALTRFFIDVNIEEYKDDKDFYRQLQRSRDIADTIRNKL